MYYTIYKYVCVFRSFPTTLLVNKGIQKMWFWSLRGVVVHGLPETPSRVTVTKGGTLSINCHYVDEPPLPVDEEVQWYSDTPAMSGYLSYRGQLLDGLNSGKYDIHDNGMSTEMNIRNVTERDAGRYVCKRSNHADAIIDVDVVNGEFWTDSICFSWCITGHIPLVLWHCWLGDRKGIGPEQELDVGLLVVMIWLELCTSYAVVTISIVLSSNKIQNGEILVTIDLRSTWKMAVKTERVISQGYESKWRCVVLF